MKRLLITILVGVIAAGWVAAVWAQENPPVVKTLQRVQGKVNPPPAASPAPAATPPPSAAPAAPGAAAAPAAPSDDNYLMEGEVLYRHQTERDPFSPLVRTAGGGPTGASEVKRKPCPPGQTGLCKFTVEECTLEAILRTPEGVMAWFQGPDNKAYKIITGERFADGVVLDVNYDTGEITIQQELTDTTAVKPFRNLVLKIRKQEGEGQ